MNLLYHRTLHPLIHTVGSRARTSPANPFDGDYVIHGEKWGKNRGVTPHFPHSPHHNRLRAHTSDFESRETWDTVDRITDTGNHSKMLGSVPTPGVPTSCFTRTFYSTESVEAIGEELIGKQSRRACERPVAPGSLGVHLDPLHLSLDRFRG